MLLMPDKIHSKSKSKKFSNVWAGSYNTVALTTAGEVLVMGLNNYSQMGIDHNKSGLTFFMPVLSEELSGRDWEQVAIGQHHTLGLDRETEPGHRNLNKSEQELGPGLDLEYETEMTSNAPEPATYETAYVTSHKVH